MIERPGVMFYFAEVDPLLDNLSSEEIGNVFREAMTYARDGAYNFVELSAIERLAVQTLIPSIDRDAEAYGDKVRQAQYARYCREAAKLGEKPMAKEVWAEQLTD